MNEGREDKNQPSTFVVELQYCQNATWQGSIRWVEAGKSAHFRSEYEMLRLMDEASRMDQGYLERPQWQAGGRNAP